MFLVATLMKALWSPQCRIGRSRFRELFRKKSFTFDCPAQPSLKLRAENARTYIHIYIYMHAAAASESRSHFNIMRSEGRIKRQVACSAWIFDSVIRMYLTREILRLSLGLRYFKNRFGSSIMTFHCALPIPIRIFLFRYNTKFDEWIYVVPELLAFSIFNLPFIFEWQITKEYICEKSIEWANDIFMQTRYW